MTSPVSRLWTLVSLAAFSLAIYGCVDSPSALAPQGPGAARVANLWWVIFGMGSAIYVGVMALLVLALVRRGSGRFDDRPGLNINTAFIVGGGVALPLLVLIALFFLTLRDSAALASPPSPPVVTIEVVGHQFWWEVHYPDHDVITANEIHIPAGEPVELRLTALDVIHSFWVPELHGKTDLVPGTTNATWLQADRPGIYRGVCAEYCGMQHAHMQMLVIAQLREEFEAWLEQQSQPAPEPIDPLLERGQQVFLETACAACHAIKGTPADARVGPDLTHLASRQTIAARMLENSPENLARWVADPQGVKPGNNMPRVALAGDDFEALIAYLASLE